VPDTSRRDAMCNSLVEEGSLRIYSVPRSCADPRMPPSAAYYYREGVGSGATKFLLHFEVRPGSGFNGPPQRVYT
jgi:hypothetical protein